MTFTPSPAEAGTVVATNPNTHFVTGETVKRTGAVRGSNQEAEMSRRDVKNKRAAASAEEHLSNTRAVDYRKTVLFVAGARALLGKRICNDSETSGNGDSGQGRVIEQLASDPTLHNLLG